MTKQNGYDILYASIIEGSDTMDETSVKEAVEELKSASEDELKQVIEKWFESTKTQSMRLGAYYISAGVYGVIQKHLNEPKPSLRSYKRCIEEIIKIISVQLKQTEQNDSENENEQGE